jgi:hypothetical protein
MSSQARRRVAVCLGLLAVATVAAAEEAPERMDGLAVLVGGDAPGQGVDAILLSDVELRARILQAGQSKDPVALDPLPSTLLQATLNEIIGEHLIAREARRVQAASTSAADVERERRQLARAAGGQERMQALLELLSATTDELEAIARRRALVGAFLSANLEGVTIVTDSEVERAYEAEKSAFAGQERAAALAELRTRLSRRALDRTIQRWVSVLRSRTTVRVYVQY